MSEPKTIRIIAVPPGFAPLEIRRQWVGVEIPLVSDEELTEAPGIRLGLENGDGYIVATGKAIEALKSAGLTEAAEFWASYDLIGNFLIFRQDVCQLL